MYAIRSYYEFQPFAGDRFKPIGLLIEQQNAEFFSADHRITSYNVCYTKLLRNKIRNARNTHIRSTMRSYVKMVREAAAAGDLV